MSSPEFFGEGARFHHVGLAVKSIEEAWSGVEIFADPIQRVGVAFVEMNGVTVELIEPHGDTSPVQTSIRKGVKLVHLCFEVPDIVEAIEAAKGFGFHSLGASAPAVAFGGRYIAWVFSPVFGLVELLQA